MVRVFLKGGVWKNSEDEILKAAVQKYGKNQWARVASLLNRKSAKQCKARWHEWLDPSVRKVEWSREEEEKLLHLAKLMPAQWKTIGPLVGRTASQCQEHYEKLLDEAATSADGDTTSNLRAHASQQPLRPGQIDSHPETKPARPDPIDMDEDEIEMLQEARARLANTQGKKAKRKAREKMLQEAKRLADLQKRRELKQAGLLSSAARKQARKRNRDIDLGVEIPFHKPAPAGFHDVTAEDERAESIRRKRLKQVDYQKINETNYKTRDREAALAKKREEARLRTLEKSNMQYVIAQVSKKNDPLDVSRKRGPLNLPAPNVSDTELNQIAKLQAAQGSSMNDTLAAIAGGDNQNSATQALLSDYSDRPLPTPMRTPMTSSTSSKPSKQEAIMREASNLRMLERGQTPLLGGENPEIVQHDAKGTGDDDDVGDTNTLGPSVIGATPRLPDRGGVGATPRDQLGLNRPTSELRHVSDYDDTASVGASTFATSTTMSVRELARQEKRAAKRARKELAEALKALPAPQYEYELAVPQLPGADDDDGDGPNKVETVMEEDMEDVEKAEQERQRLEAEKQYEARSSVVKRDDLPRPVGGVHTETFVSTAQSDAEALIEQERYLLLRHDAHAFPAEPPAHLEALVDSKTKKKRKKSPLPPEAPLDYIPEDFLTAAKAMIDAECQELTRQKQQSILDSGMATSDNSVTRCLSLANVKLSMDAVQDYIYHNNNSKWTVVDNNNDNDKNKAQMAAARVELQTIKEAATILWKKKTKAESKISVVNGGYVKRADQLTNEIAQTFTEYSNSIIEESVYQSLRHDEELGGVQRIDKLRLEIAAMERDVNDLQMEYNLLVEQE